MQDFWLDFARILFAYISTSFSFLAEASTLTRYIFEVESMHTFHVLEFLLLSFAPARDRPIRYIGRSEWHDISIFKCFSSFVRFSLVGKHRFLVQVWH